METDFKKKAMITAPKHNSRTKLVSVFQFKILISLSFTSKLKHTMFPGKESTMNME